MNIGINENIDPEQISFYESFYDILRTPDFNEKSRLLKPEHGLHYYGSPKNKVCRFCGKSEGEVSFKKIAHVFPEAIGNSVWHHTMNVMFAISFLEAALKMNMAIFLVCIIALCK